jgi:membrane protease YdiL (CAAX protease family)
VNAETAAAFGQATLFALGHSYLGPRGMLNAGALALVAGLGYRWNGRNLWPLFMAHGLVDSVGLTALYLGVAHS